VALGTALLTLVLVSLPSRVSVAHQNGGDANGDVVRRATLARNGEFVGRGHGAPANATALAGDPYGGPKVGLADYVLGDHSASVALGGALSGAYDGLSAAGRRPESKAVGLIAFLVEIVGAIFLLTLPRVRLFVLLPAAMAFVPWFFADRGALPPFVAGAPLFVALLMGGATLAYVAAGALSERFGLPEPSGSLRSWAARMGRSRRTTQPG
jgi:hypothetical protein